MRTLRTAPLIVAVLLTTLFAGYYIKTVRWMLDGGLETSGASFVRVCYDLRSDIDVIVWRPFPQSGPSVLCLSHLSQHGRVCRESPA